MGLFFSPQCLIIQRNSVLACLLACCLTGCMGGPIAQQVASSLFMRAADQVTSNAYEAHLLRDPSHTTLPTTTIIAIPGHGSTTSPSPQATPQFDPYWTAFLNTGFTEIKPSAEPLPTQSNPANRPHDDTPPITASELVAIEVWNILLDEEKNTVLEQARLRGHDAAQLKAWSSWQMAIGASASSPQTPITFIVPPELGRLNSGQEILVEIAGQDQLNIARYTLQPSRAFRQASGQRDTRQP